LGTAEIRLLEENPTTGKITLKPSIKDNQTVISVSVDGARIGDPGQVRAKAIGTSLNFCEEARRRSLI
jgi:chemotaxis protein histidine kinase CheA